MTVRPPRRAKRPRSLNFVSFLLALALAASVYGAAKFAPVYVLRSKAASIVSDAMFRYFRFAHHEALGRVREEAALRDEVVAQLRNAGVDDPDLAVSFSRSSSDIGVRADYTVVVQHPWVNRRTVLRFHPEARTSTERPFQ